MRQSCGSPVVVVKPSENGLGDDGLRDVDYCWLLSRDPLPDSLMGSCLVEVLLVLGDEPTKMLVIKDDHVVEDLAQCTTDKSFSDGVHVRGSHRGLDHPDPDALGCTVKRRSELSVAISQQALRCFSVHCCVSQLLGCPLLGRVSAGCCVDNLARAEMHDEERIHLSEENVIRLDEIADPRGIRVVRREGGPTLSSTPCRLLPDAPGLLPPCPGERAGIRPFLAANLASSSQGMTGADIAYLCQRAVMFCVKDAVDAYDPNEVSITRHHFDADLGLMTAPHATNAAHEAPSASSAASADCKATPRRTLLDAVGYYYGRLCPADPTSAPREL